MTALQALARTDILFLNWRDPSHPQAGGAEAYCFEIARRMAAAGARVTLFASRFPGSAPIEYADGVLIRREGDTFGVYLAAARHLLRHRRTYDAVVDFQNGIPFFSPVFTPRWSADVCVIHHVHQDQFDLRFRWPLATVGRLLEKHVSRLVYRGRPLVVVSPSTREGVRRELGFRNPVFVVPNGSSGPSPCPVDRSGSPVVAVVTRLVPQKRVDLLIRALPVLLERYPDLHVDIGGRGSELPRLRALVDGLGLREVVEFHGFMSTQRKRELLGHAWLTVVPSVGEGWGLAVMEANSVGTPALAYDVPGLRDAVQDGENGWLLIPGADLATALTSALGVLGEPAARERVAQRCLRWSDDFSWGDSAERLARVVHNELRRVHQHRRSRRHPHDLTAITRFEAQDAEEVERRMHNSLRETDSWHRQGSSFRLLLGGCDEVLADRVLARLGIAQATLGLANRRDILVRQGLIKA